MNPAELSARQRRMSEGMASLRMSLRRLEESTDALRESVEHFVAQADKVLKEEDRVANERRR